MIIFNSTKQVYTLKIRYSGREDDVYVFSTKEKAEAMVFEYFTQCGEEYPDMTFEEFENHIFLADIGYFDIKYTQIDPRSYNE